MRLDKLNLIIKMEIMKKTPTFSFALREDLVNNKEFMPTRAEPMASGWDVKAAMKDRNPLSIKPFEYVKIPLGFRAICPEGYWYELKPRSSSFAKKKMHALYGTIDQNYESELVLACQYIPDQPKIVSNMNFCINSYIQANELVIEFGEAIGQIIPVKRQEMIVSEMSNEEFDNSCKARGGLRGRGGFGSTSK